MKNDGMSHTGDKKKIYKKIDDTKRVDGMQKDAKEIINYLKIDENVGFTNCSICGKTIGALSDMKIKGKFYCSKCRMNIINDESERDILLMRKNELLTELTDIECRLYRLKTTSYFV